MPARLQDTKPDRSILIRYVPGGSASARKRPSLSVSVVRATSVSVLTTMAVAAGSTAPDSSLTTPSRSAPVNLACANAGVDIITAAQTIASVLEYRPSMKSSCAAGKRVAARVGFRMPFETRRVLGDAWGSASDSAGRFQLVVARPF